MPRRWSARWRWRARIAARPENAISARNPWIASTYASTTTMAAKTSNGASIERDDCGDRSRESIAACYRSATRPNHSEGATAYSPGVFNRVVGTYDASIPERTNDRARTRPHRPPRPRGRPRHRRPVGVGVRGHPGRVRRLVAGVARAWAARRRRDL